MVVRIVQLSINLALRVSPSIPQAGECEQLAVVHFETVRLLGLAVLSSTHRNHLPG